MLTTKIDREGSLIISGASPADPAEKPSHELSLMCDDLDATVAELRAKGIEFRGEPENQGFGTVITMVLPGGVDMMLYQPRHATAV